MKLQKNWHILPLIRRSKKPPFKQWQKIATSNPTTIKKWAAEYPNCNWGLLPSKSGLVVIDVDAKGMGTWKALCKKYGEPKTLKAISGSGKGLHYVFKDESKLGYRGKLSLIKNGRRKLVDGIDVRYNNYIAIEPSMGSKRTYKWIKKMAPQSMPAWVLKRVEKTLSQRPKKQSQVNFDRSFFKELIDGLREKPFNYDTWLQIGMALHHASGGSEDGFDLFEHVTTGVNYEAGDEELAAEKWASFGSSGGDLVTAGTLLKLAGDLEVKLPQLGLDPVDYFDDETQSVKDAKKAIPPRAKRGLNPDLWGVTKNGRQVCDDPKELVKRLNNEGYALLNSPRTSGGIIRTFKNRGVTGYVEMSNSDFKNAVSHIALRTIQIGNDGQPKGVSYKDGFTVWLESQNKKKYTDIIFTPREVKGAFNLWDAQPIPCEAVPCDFKKDRDLRDVLRFLKYVIAGGDREVYKYVVQWLAHLVQRPHEKPSIVPVILGDEGTGKGLLTNGLMKRILGPRYTMVSKRSTLKSKFNKDLAFKFLITLDETCWQGDKELQSILRNHTGNDRIEVEEKFGARYEIDDYSRTIITANTPDAVKLQASNRRYLVLQSPAKFAGHPLLGKIWTEVKYGDVCGKFYHYLLKVDLSGFKPHVFPKSIDKQGLDLKLEGDIVREFLHDMFSENPRPIFYRNKGVIKAELYEEFLGFCEKLRNYSWQMSQHKFCREVKEVVPLLAWRDGFAKIEGKAYRVFKVDPRHMAHSFYDRLGVEERKRKIYAESRFYAD